MHAKPDSSQTVAFLREYLPDGPWLLAAMEPERNGRPEFARFAPEKVFEASKWIAERVGEKNLYFHVNPTREGLVKKAQATDVTRLSYLHVDVDPRAGDDPEEERARIRHLLTEGLPEGVPEPTFVIFSGGGYQAFWRLDEPLELDGTQECAEDAKLYNVQLERVFAADSCHNIDRLMRLPGTINIPDAKKRAKGRVVAETELVVSSGSTHDLATFEKAAAVTQVVTQVDTTAPRLRGVDELDEWKVPDRVKAAVVSGPDPDEPKTGDNSRSAWVFDVCCQLARFDVPDPVIYSVITDPGFRISESVIERGGDMERYARRTIANARERVGEDWSPASKDGRPVKSYTNARFAVRRLGVECTRDVFRNKLVVGGHALGEYTGAVTDSAMSMLRQLIVEKFGFDPGKEHLEDATRQLCIENPFDPVVDGLAALKWDGTPRLDSWLTTYLGTPANAYTAAVGRLLLTAAVRRARQPGCKFDSIVVLEGDQGTGKSTALLILAGHDDFFSDQDILAGNAREQAENIEGVWFYELAELEGLRKAQVTKVKAFASRQHDRARAAYGRHREDKPRQCVFVGTTNDSHYLTDRTGNRRFLPVETGDIDLEALRRDRDQLMAEACVVEADGAPLHLPPEIWSVAAREQAARLQEDPWEAVLADLEPDPLGGGPVVVDRSGKHKVTTKALLARLGVESAIARPEHTTRLGHLMRQHGWTGPKPLKIRGEVHKGYWRMPPKVTEGTTDEG